MKKPQLDPNTAPHTEPTRPRFTVRTRLRAGELEGDSYQGRRSTGGYVPT